MRGVKMDSRDDDKNKTPPNIPQNEMTPLPNDLVAVLMNITTNLTKDTDKFDNEIKELFQARMNLIKGLHKRLDGLKGDTIKDKFQLTMVTWFTIQIEKMLPILKTFADNLNPPADKNEAKLYKKIIKKIDKLEANNSSYKNYFEKQISNLEKLEYNDAYDFKPPTPEEIQRINPKIDKLFDLYAKFIEDSIRWKFLENYALNYVTNATKLKDNYNSFVDSSGYLVNLCNDFNTATTTKGTQQVKSTIEFLIKHYQINVDRILQSIKKINVILIGEMRNGAAYSLSVESNTFLLTYCAYLADRSKKLNNTPYILLYKNPDNLKGDELDKAFANLDKIDDYTLLPALKSRKGLDGTQLKKSEVIFPQQTIKERAIAIKEMFGKLSNPSDRDTYDTYRINDKRASRDFKIGTKKI